MIDNDQAVYKIPAKRGTQIFARVRDFKGKVLVDLRLFFEKEGEWFPTTKGIVLDAEQIGELEAAVKALRAELDSRVALKAA